MKAAEFLKNKYSNISGVVVDEEGNIIERADLSIILEAYHQYKLKTYKESCYTDQDIELAYLTGVLNVAGLDGLQREIDRLKNIGKTPCDIFIDSTRPISGQKTKDK